VAAMAEREAGEVSEGYEEVVGGDKNEGVARGNRLEEWQRAYVVDGGEQTSVSIGKSHGGGTFFLIGAFVFFSCGCGGIAWAWRLLYYCWWWWWPQTYNWATVALDGLATPRNDIGSPQIGHAPGTTDTTKPSGHNRCVWWLHCHVRP